MIFFLYNGLLTFLLILAAPWFLAKALFQKRFRESLSQRLGWISGSFPPHALWIHAASVGEVFCSIPLLKKIKADFPQIPIVFTTLTPTGQEAVRTRFPEADRIFFLPFDHPLFIRKAVDQIRPRLFLIAETELWPNLLRTLGKKEIPVVLFNGRISEKSFRRYHFFKFFFKHCLKNVSLLLMQTEEDRTRMIQMGVNPHQTKTAGNLKFDQTFPIVTREATDAMAKGLALQREDKVLIGGSTHSGEEEVLISLFKELSREDRSLRLILAPRHLNRLEEVEKLLKRGAIPWSRRTSLKTTKGRPRPLPEVILLDTMGELMNLYSLGTLVFIGGSLVPVGGHNPLEPLYFKKCVLYGPYMHHFTEISNRLIEAGGAVQVSGREALFSQVKHLLSDEKQREEIGEKGYQFLQRHQGSTERMFEEIRPLLKNIADFRLKIV